MIVRVYPDRYDIIGNFQNAYTFARKAIFELFDNRKNVVVTYCSDVGCSRKSEYGRDVPGIIQPHIARTSKGLKLNNNRKGKRQRTG